jgi:prolyl oligopeptidase
MRTAVLLATTLAFAATAAERFVYPKAAASDQVDVYHGTSVPDPYRWLEDPNSPETRAWIEAQNAISMPYLSAIPERAAIRKRLTELWNYERFSDLSKAGNRYFWYRNDGLQERSVLYTAGALSAAGTVLIDPNKYADKTQALAGAIPSHDGKLLAFQLQRAGSDWREIGFLDVATGKELPDRLKWIKFSVPVWSEDGKGLYYSRYAEPADAMKPGELTNQKLYYHRLGTPQSEDTLVLFRPEQPRWTYDAEETEDGRYVVISIQRSTEEENAVFYRKVEGGPMVELLPSFDAVYIFCGSDGDVLYFRTTRNAPKGRLIAIDLRKPEPANWREVIPESVDVLEKVSYMNGQFIAAYMKDARTQVRLFDRTGKPVGEVPLPGIGVAYGFTGRQSDTETFFTFTSYTVPPTLYRLDLKTRATSVFRQPKMNADLSKYETSQVFYKSKDGTRIPMFLTYTKGLKRDGSNPVYLFGYGGFRVPVLPYFNTSALVWLEMGGVMAVPNIRGGGEYGAKWHEAGIKTRKQTGFDDFIAAAEYLIAEKYTQPSKIAISGGSNGGLLVAACLVQRPDLFGAVVPKVGVLDMLRFHKFTIGWAWVSDYGSPDNPEEFKALRAYSPYHNIRKGAEYPPTLITTADHDDRVVPAHSFKFAAALQAAQEGKAPVMIRIQTKAGHGGGLPLSMIIDEHADVWAFIVKNLGMTPSFAKPGGN